MRFVKVECNLKAVMLLTHWYSLMLHGNSRSWLFTDGLMLCSACVSVSEALFL